MNPATPPLLNISKFGTPEPAKTLVECPAGFHFDQAQCKRYARTSLHFDKLSAALNPRRAYRNQDFAVIFRNAAQPQGILRVRISTGVSLRNRRSHSLRSGHALPVEAISLPKFGIAAIRDCGNQDCFGKNRLAMTSPSDFKKTLCSASLYVDSHFQ
jgi:hypothetical protein